MTQYSALQFSTNALYQAVNQVAHGFVLGDVVRWNGAAFVLAQSNLFANVGIIGMISSVPNVNSFFLTQAGLVSPLVTAPVNPGGAYVAGTIYYLSPVTPGKLTATAPVATNNMIVPCYVAYTATSGFFFGTSGTEIEPGTLFNWSTIVDVDTQMLVNNGYIVEATVPLTLDLPALSTVGDILKIASTSTSVDSVLITQIAGQYILLAEDESTTGAAGGLELEVTNGIRRGSCELVCVVANLGWRFMSGTGTWDLI